MRLNIRFAALLPLLASFACSNPSTGNDGGSSPNGSDSGIADGGVSDGGSTDGGSLDGSFADSGMADSGTSDGGLSDAGSYDAGFLSPPHTDAGSISVLASDLDQAEAVVVQGSTIFWVASDDPGAVLSVPLSGGTPSTISRGDHNPAAIATDSENIYWADYGSVSALGLPITNSGSVLQAPLGGGAVVTLAAMQQAPASIAIDHGNVYWTTGSYGGTDGTILSTPKGGGSTSTLYSGQSTPDAIAVDSANVYWANGGTQNGLTRMYNNDGAVLQAPISIGGTIVTLAAGVQLPIAVAVDATNVYWSSYATIVEYTPVPMTGAIVYAPIGGGTTTTLAQLQDLPQDIAVQNSILYWTDTGSGDYGTVNQAQIDGGAITTLVSQAINPYGLALTGNSVVWTDHGAPGHQSDVDGGLGGQVLEWSPPSDGGTDAGSTDAG